MKHAQPVNVSECKEVCDNAGHYTGETSVVVNVIGNCVPRAFLGGMAARPPVVHGDIIYHIAYVYDANISIVEYRFKGRRHISKAESFRQKMLKKINKQKIKNYIAQLDGNTRWVLLSFGKSKIK